MSTGSKLQRIGLCTIQTTKKVAYNQICLGSMENALAANKTLEEVDLEDNNQSQLKTQTGLGKGLAANSSLRKLNLAENLILHNSILEVLGRNGSLRVLNLRKITQCKPKRRTLVQG